MWVGSHRPAKVLTRGSEVTRVVVQLPLGGVTQDATKRPTEFEIPRNTRVWLFEKRYAAAWHVKT